MNESRRVAESSSFERTAGGAAGRGALLIAVAVLIGFLLLNANDSDEPTDVASDSSPTEDDAAVVEDGSDEIPADDESATDGEVTDGDAQPEPGGPRPPAEVKVLVANGSDVSGAAGALTERASALGYEVLTPTDTSAPASQASVFYAAGFQAEANRLAADLGVAVDRVLPLPTPAPVADLAGAKILIVLDRAAATAVKSGATPAGDEANDVPPQG